MIKWIPVIATVTTNRRSAGSAGDKLSARGTFTGCEWMDLDGQFGDLARASIETGQDNQQQPD